MTDAIAIAREHWEWAMAQGMTPADVLQSVGWPVYPGSDEATAVIALELAWRRLQFR